MKGISRTSAPSARRSSDRQPACSRARETSTRQPSSGRGPLDLLVWGRGGFGFVNVGTILLISFLWFARHNRCRAVNLAQDLIAAAAQNCLAGAFAQLDRVVAGLNLANDLRTVRACANGGQAQDA